MNVICSYFLSVILFLAPSMLVEQLSVFWPKTVAQTKNNVNPCILFVQMIFSILHAITEKQGFIRHFSLLTKHGGSVILEDKSISFSAFSREQLPNVTLKSPCWIISISPHPYVTRI